MVDASFLILVGGCSFWIFVAVKQVFFGEADDNNFFSSMISFQISGFFPKFLNVPVKNKQKTFIKKKIWIIFFG